MSVERAEQRSPAAHRSAPPVAAVAALVLLIGVLAGSPYISPKGPLWVSVVLLGLGLAGGQLARGRAAQRLAQNGSVVAALVVLIWTLSSEPYFLSPKWPLQVSVVLLGLGLCLGLAGGQLARGAAAQRLAQTVAGVAALIVLIWTLSSEPYAMPKWPLQLAVVILGLGLVAGPLAQLVRGQVAYRSAQTVAAVGALIVLIGELVGSPYFDPKGPLQVSAVLLGFGLVAGPLSRFASRPGERVLSERVAELSRTRRGALDVQASELRRIERDLHDGAQARLVALSMKLGRAEERFRDREGGDEVSAVLREAREDASAAIRELRELARGIAPPVLADRGLEAAARSLADRTGARVEVAASLERRPVPAVEIAAYFVVAEALTNAAKHAPGASVEVHLSEHGGDLFVEVTDFGPGGADAMGGGGLTGLRQRVEALDGRLMVTSPEGVGTQVEAVLPCGW